MDTAKIASSLREMIMLASHLRNLINQHNPDLLRDDVNDAADRNIDEAWEVFEEADAELRAFDEAEDDDLLEPPDFETLQAERDRQEYEAGKAEAELRRAERKIYGDELADAFHAQDDLNRYNRGEDD